VVLEVLFGASGRLTVMRVVRGLGHGLDEAAVQAVAQMVFKPARRHGEPIDSRAMLRVLFQLA
jgi:TonB family protein